MKQYSQTGLAPVHHAGAQAPRQGPGSPALISGARRFNGGRFGFVLQWLLGLGSGLVRMQAQGRASEANPPAVPRGRRRATPGMNSNLQPSTALRATRHETRS